jgi:thiol:disulfide interchange protein DsbD
VSSGASALFLAAAVLLGPLVASGAPSLTASGRSKNAVVTLVPEHGALQPGQPLWIGLHFKLAPEWHTYWKNGGDAGLPARIRWRLPDGFTAGAIQWPVPERIPTEPLMSYGYGREVLLLVELKTPASLKPGPVTLGARLDWLECNDACLPGKAELEIALPVASGAPKPLAEWSAAFQQARARLPKGAGVKAEATTSGNALTLVVAGIAIPKQAYFYPAKPEVVEHAAAQTLSASGKAFQLKLTRAIDTVPPQTLEGVLEADGQGYEISTPVKAEKLRR